MILDLTVPGGMGGQKAIRELKRLDPKVKALVSSGYSTNAIMSDFRKFGFRGVIAKPYELAKLSTPSHKYVTYRGRRGARSARREEGEYYIVFDQRATQQTGMNRRPNATVFM